MLLPANHPSRFYPARKFTNSNPIWVADACGRAAVTCPGRSRRRWVAWAARTEALSSGAGASARSPSAAVLDAAGAAACGTRAVFTVFTVLAARGVFQQYHANATHTAANRIAKRLCSASMDGGLYSAGGGLSGLFADRRSAMERDRRAEGSGGVKSAKVGPGRTCGASWGPAPSAAAAWAAMSPSPSAWDLPLTPGVCVRLRWRRGRPSGRRPRIRARSGYKPRRSCAVRCRSTRRRACSCRGR